MPKTLFGTGGDFYEDDPLCYLIPSDQAAAHFLVVLEDIVPSALEQLENEVLVLATDSFIEFSRYREVSHRLAQSIFDDMFPRYPPEAARRFQEVGFDPEMLDFPDDERLYQRLRGENTAAIERLLVWARHFRISSIPVLRLAVETLADWKYQESRSFERSAGWGVRVAYCADPDREEKEWNLNLLWSGSDPTLSSSELELAVSRDPFQERKKDFVRRARKEFETKLDEYLQQQTDALARGRAKPVPSKRSAEEHFNWLVKHQVLDESFASIASEAEKDPKTVREGVRGAAELAEFKLRKSELGRPPGLEETKPRNRPAR